MNWVQSKHVSFGLIMVIFISAFSTTVASASSYTYDELNRLTAVTMDSGERLVYSYDAAGNMTGIQQVQVAAAAPSYGNTYGWETYSSPGVIAVYEAVTNSVYGKGVQVNASATNGGEVVISQSVTVTGNVYHRLQGGILISSLDNAVVQAYVQFYNASGQFIGESNVTFDKVTGGWNKLAVDIRALPGAVGAKVQFKLRLDTNAASADIAVSGIQLAPVGGQS